MRVYHCKFIPVVLGLVILFGCWAGQANAQTEKEILREMQQQIKALQSRVTELEGVNSTLQNRLQKQEKVTQTIETSVVKEDKPAVSSSQAIELYGYLKFDASYDTDQTSVGNFAQWAVSDSVTDDDDRFNATANQTRLGMKLHGPDLGDAKTSGQVEVDFYGGGAENKSHLMMRHAFMKLDWPDYDFNIIAGQTSDVIAPLVPNTINYSVAWWAGDIGYRRPQFRLTKGFAVNEEVRLQMEGALTRTIGDSIFGMNAGSAGEDSGFPTLQGRLALSFPLLSDKDTTIGLSGHWGQEEVDTDLFDNGNDIDTWSGVLDLNMPLCEKAALKGEAWIGENMDAYLGGIAQGIHGVDRDGNPANGAEYPLEGIRSNGGWAALALGPFDDLTYTIGATIDDPDNDDLNAAQRSQNSSIFGNVFWQLNKSVLTGLEISYWDTEYKDREDGDSIRFQATLMYKF